MKLTVRKDSVNYTCTVVQIKQVYDIEGADRIKRVVIFGNNVIVSNSVQEGDIMLYFPSGTQLNADYCAKNNLYDKSELNQDKTQKGFISYKQRRVRAIKLRGVISDGMLMPTNSLLPFISQRDINNLDVGQDFTTINGNDLCKKYFVLTKQTQSSREKTKGKTKKFDRLVENQFYLHGDTSNLRRNIHAISPNTLISISYKKHGCQFTAGNILTKRKLNWLERLSKKLGVKVEETIYDVVYSSRKVIKSKNINPDQNEGFYGENIWGIVAQEIKDIIPKGYTLYGEIMGYLPSGGFIQKNYDYGCEVGQHKLYIYKISVVNSDGQVIYLSDPQIQEFCEKYGLNFKDTFIYHGLAGDLYPHIVQDNDWGENFLTTLEQNYNEKDCWMCTNKVPEEGIILRVEKLNEYEAYKLKSKRFLLMESDEQEQEITNIEDEH